MQVDNLTELPKEKRPPEYILWWGKPEDLEEWLDKVFPKDKKNFQREVFIDPSMIEG